MLEYEVHARRVDAHGSLATTKQAELVIDTDLNGRDDAFNPAELFLASIAACIFCSSLCAAFCASMHSRCTDAAWSS